MSKYIRHEQIWWIYLSMALPDLVIISKMGLWKFARPTLHDAFLSFSQADFTINEITPVVLGQSYNCANAVK